MTSVPLTHRPRGARALVGAATAVLSVAATLSVGLAVPALAQGDATAVQTSIVSDKPASFTPAVKDGVVESVVQVGGTIVIGGTFTQLVKARARRPTRAPVWQRSTPSPEPSPRVQPGAQRRGDLAGGCG